MLYLAIRNMAKTAQGPVLDSETFRRVFVWYVFLLLRVAQDQIAMQRTHGQRPKHDMYVILRDKIVFWLSHFHPSMWPSLSDVVEDVRRLPGVQNPQTLPPPAWLMYASPSKSMRFGIGAHVDFRSPLPEKLNACTRTKDQIDAERRKVTDTFLRIVENMKWIGLVQSVVDHFAGDAT
jgi:hypothetical protein